jgi:hypothetical protein
MIRCIFSTINNIFLLIIVVLILIIFSKKQSIDNFKNNFKNKLKAWDVLRLKRKETLVNVNKMVKKANNVTNKIKKEVDLLVITASGSSYLESFDTYNNYIKGIGILHNPLLDVEITSQVETINNIVKIEEFKKKSEIKYLKKLKSAKKIIDKAFTVFYNNKDIGYDTIVKMRKLERFNPS